MPPTLHLTFDDGPHPEFTPCILDVLTGHGARATFFMVGEYVDTYSEIVAGSAGAGEHGRESHADALDQARRRRG